MNLQASTMKLNYNICNLAGKISQMLIVTGLILNKVHHFLLNTDQIFDHHYLDF